MSLDLLITTPLYDGKLHHACFNGILQTVAKYGSAKVGHLANQGSFIPRLRDQLTAGFLKSGAEFMLCVDADVGWTVGGLEIMWSRLREMTLDREMVAGLYPRKNLGTDPRPIAALLENERDGMREAACVGAGFLLLHRKGIERMCERYKDLSYPSNAVNPDDGTIVGLWSPFCAVKAGDRAMYLGEDYSFCQRWREMGGKIWAVPEVQLAHVGECTYTMKGPR